MIKIQKISTQDKELAEKVYDIRRKVFVEEQKVDARDEFDEHEEHASHFLLQLNDKAIGTARWRHIGDKIKLERFAILKEYRNAGYGNILLSAVLEDVIPQKKQIYLHAQLKAVPFYERQDFQKQGEKFTECEIEHYKMVLRL